MAAQNHLDSFISTSSKPLFLSPRSRRYGIRLVFRTLASAVVVVLLYLVCTKDSTVARPNGKWLSKWSLKTKSVLPSKDTLQNLGLTESQCLATFPGLTKELDYAKSMGKFQYAKLPEDTIGLIQGRIKNGRLYLLSKGVDTEEPGRFMAALHQLNRAILTAPTALPNILFSFTTNDNPRDDSWSYSRETYNGIWLMPHFSFWAWRQPYLGSFPDVWKRINKIEAAYNTTNSTNSNSSSPWSNKISKAVWRGTTRFNPPWNRQLRPSLLKATANNPLFDVSKIDSKTSDYPDTNKTLSIEEFCQYKIIIYTEGVTYSGRLNYHQLCESVMIMPPPVYLQHISHLIRPVFSTRLLDSNTTTTPPPQARTSRFYAPSTLSNPQQQHHLQILPTGNDTWPHSYPASLANTVFVKPDWSDLDQTVRFLLDHPELSQQIARNQRHDLVDRGFFSPAAETCYWRALIRAWSEVAVFEEGEVEGEEEEEEGEGASGERWDGGDGDGDGDVEEEGVVDGLARKVDATTKRWREGLSWEVFSVVGGFPEWYKDAAVRTKRRRGV